MTCSICKSGQTRQETTTVTLQRGQATLIIKEVPADVCANCGEYYLSESVSAEVLARAELAVQHGAEVEILRYAA
jgi:YgiT-type zinc finger domain-containing protein